MDVNLTGTAWSPINTYWPSLGQVDVHFQLNGGPRDASISNFSFQILNGPGLSFPSGHGNFILSPSIDNSGLAIFGPDNSTFVWYFDGPAFAGNGYGEFWNESTAIDFQINHLDMKNVSAPEPSILVLLACGLVMLGIKHAKTA